MIYEFRICFIVYSNGAYLQISIDQERIIPIKTHHLHKSRIKNIQRFYQYMKSVIIIKKKGQNQLLSSMIFLK